MSLTRNEHNVTDVLSNHTVFEVECIDRMYLNVYVPGLQYAGGLVGYVHHHLGLPIASTAPMAKIPDRFSRDVHYFAQTQQIPWVDFAKGQRKDDLMQERLASFTETQGVVFISRAQEKTSLFRTEKRRNGDGVSYPWIVRTTGVVNHFYFYCVDEDFGPFFLKFCSYFPYNAKLCINGNHWAQHQAAKAGLGFTPLDNAFAQVDDPAALQRVCDRLGPEHIQALLDKWLRLLPNPFTDADRQDGYRYDLSILQAEFSLTQKLDKPVSGRLFFEQVIRDNLDIGRADQVSLVFARRLLRRGKNTTPGVFHTRVITDGVTPSLQAYYKHATIKQYHKEGQALRTETTINNTRDFETGKWLTHLPALREIGFQANRRLLEIQRLSCDPITGTATLDNILTPITTVTGQCIPPLKLAERRSHALLSALLMFRLQPGGFVNKDLRTVTTQLRGLQPGQVTAEQITYDLRRLKARGLISKIPRSNRYTVTDQGLDAAFFLTSIYDRFLTSAMTDLAVTDQPGRLRQAANAYRKAIDEIAAHAGLRLAA